LVFAPSSLVLTNYYLPLSEALCSYSMSSGDSRNSLKVHGMTNSKRKNVCIFVMSYVLSFNVIAGDAFDTDENTIIETLSEVSALAQVEQNCFNWNSKTSSNIQVVFSRGVYAVLNERLGKERFLKYFKASIKTPAPMAQDAINSLNMWRKSDQHEGIKTYCNEDLPYSRTAFANLYSIQLPK
jgi:hypothetical protein